MVEQAAPLAKPAPDLKIVTAPATKPAPPATVPATVSPAPQSLVGHAVNDEAGVQALIRSARRVQNRLVAATLAIVVILPTLVVGAYMAFFASDQFAAEARFSVRGAEKLSADVVGILTGAAASGASAGDSYILQEFIASREMVQRLEADVGLRARYENASIDWWARLPQGVPVEELVEYWRSTVKADYDAHSGIISLEIRAFTPEDAKVIATGVVRESLALVNRLSEQSRQDTVALASREVQFAEERLAAARTAISTFRTVEQTVDPAAIAEAHERMIAELDALRVRAEAELAQLSSVVGPEAPSRRILQNRIDALEAQIEERRKLVSTSAPSSGSAQPDGISGQLETYERLRTESDFAERAYVSSLASLEAARIEAKREQRYLAIFVEPSMPEDAQYPLRLLNTLLVAFGALVVWGIGALVYAAVKDHAV